MTRDGLRTFLFTLLILAIAFLSYSIGAMSAERDFRISRLFGNANVDLIKRVLVLIDKNYVSQILDEKELVYGAIEGIIGRLREEPYKDSYSAFLEPAAWRNLSAATEGSYSGVGIVIGLDPERQIPIISYVFEGTPAQTAGIKERDYIVRVDGESTTGETLNESARRILGEEGTEVTLSIMREGWENPKDFKMKRTRVEIPSVVDVKLLSAEIGYLRISSFGVKTAEEVKEAISSLQGKGAKGIVLDLRYNPGGLLTSAVSVADVFLGEGKIVTVRQKGREDVTISAENDQDDVDLPIVILVNEGSASASEVFAGALQDNGRARLVGTKTFGKGSVQEVFELGNDGSALSLVVGSYLTPTGHDLNQEPLSPDVEASMDVIKKRVPEIAKEQDKLAELSTTYSQLNAELYTRFYEAQVETARQVAEEAVQATKDEGRASM